MSEIISERLLSAEREVLFISRSLMDGYPIMLLLAMFPLLPAIVVEF